MLLQVKDYIIIAYMVAAILTAGYAWSRLRDPKIYRFVLSFIIGVFWPIPAAILIWLWLEGAVIDIANWIERNF